MTLPAEFLADFPHDTSLLVVIGPDEETVSATKDLFFEKIDWTVIEDLREASEMIADRVDETPVGVDSYDHWAPESITVDVGIVDAPVSVGLTRSPIDPITLLALSHVQDKGPEVAVSGVIGLVWGEDEISPEDRSISGDLFGQILGRALLLDADQVVSLIEPSV